MPFLDNLATMLGGWSDVKQIDQSGFDFREKRRQEELARQQQQQQWDQANQDYAAKAMAEAAVGGMPEDQLGAFLGPGLSEQQRRFQLARGLGGAAQAKSSLAQTKAYTDAMLLGQRGEQVKELEGVRGKNRLEAIDQTQAGQMEMLTKRLEAMERQGSLNRDNALLLAALRRGEGGTGKWAWNTKTNTPEYVSDEALKSAPPGIYSDITSGRQRAADISIGENASTALAEMKDRLARYEKTQEGLGRYVPAQMSPEKYVAWEAYRSSLQSMGQFFGRQMMKDARVSNEDRQAYANAIGVSNQITTMLDPKEARRRAEFLEKMMLHYQMKYGGGGEAGGVGAPGEDTPAATPARPPGVPEGAKFDPVRRRWRL